MKHDEELGNADMDAFLPPIETTVGYPDPRDSARAQQRSRIDEFRRSSFEESDPLHAILGNVIADVASLSMEYAACLEDSFREAHDLDALTEQSVGLTDFLKLTRQLDRFVQLRRILQVPVDRPRLPEPEDALHSEMNTRTGGEQFPVRDQQPA